MTTFSPSHSHDTKAPILSPGKPLQFFKSLSGKSKGPPMLFDDTEGAHQNDQADSADGNEPQRSSSTGRDRRQGAAIHSDSSTPARARSPAKLQKKHSAGGSKTPKQGKKKTTTLRRISVDQLTDDEKFKASLAKFRTKHGDDVASEALQSALRDLGLGGGVAQAPRGRRASYTPGDIARSRSKSGHRRGRSPHTSCAAEKELRSNPLLHTMDTESAVRSSRARSIGRILNGCRSASKDRARSKSETRSAGATKTTVSSRTEEPARISTAVST